MRLGFSRKSKKWLAERGVSDEELKAAAAELLRGEQLTKFQQVSGQPFFFKAYRYQNRWEILLPSLRARVAEKAYLKAGKLKKLGINSPKPVALLYQRKFGLVLVTEELKCGGTLDESIRNILTPSPTPQLTEFLKRLASFLCRLHDKGIYHSDLHDKNIWLDNGEFYLLDLEAIRFVSEISLTRRIRNLARIIRNLGTVAAGLNLQAEPLALELANYYFEAAKMAPPPDALDMLKAAASRGMERWQETNPTA